jgi:cytochrome b561
MKQYSPTTKLIHGLFIVLLSLMITTGIVMTEVSFENPLTYHLPKYHYLLGLSVLFIACYRIVRWWLHRNMPPPFQDNQFKWLLGRSVQLLLLVSTLALVATGYCLATMDGTPALLPWGTWLPQVLPDDIASEKQLYRYHQLALYVFLFLLSLHLLGAITGAMRSLQALRRIF